MGASGEIIGNLGEGNFANVFIGLRNERAEAGLDERGAPAYSSYKQAAGSQAPDL